MAGINKIQSFKTFSEMKQELNQAKIEEEKAVKKAELATKLSALLDEMNITSFEELDEETKQKFIDKAMGNVSEEETEETEEVSESCGKCGKTPCACEETEEISEAIVVTGKRDAKKVMNTYIKFFEKFPALGRNAMGVPPVHHIGAVKELYVEAMTDANFSREIPATKNVMKGRVFPVEIKVVDLGNTAIKIPAGKLMDICATHGSAISGAAKFSGLAIVEGTAMYLDSIGKTKEAEELMAKFNKAFANESAEIRVDAEAKLNERNEMLCEATVEMDAMAPDDRNFLKWLGKNKVEIIKTEMSGPGGGHPVITMQGKRKDLEKVLADCNFGWCDEDLAEYIEESMIIEGAKEEQIAMELYTEVVGGKKYSEESLANADMDEYNEIVAAAGHSGSKAKKIADEFRKIATMESVVTEAEVKSAEEFAEYAMTVLKQAFGDDFDEAKAQEVIDGLTSKYGEDYGAMVGALQSSLAEAVEVTEKKSDGTISDDEDERREALMAEVESAMDQLLAKIKADADDIGGSFRSPGIMYDAKKIIDTKLKRFK